MTDCAPERRAVRRWAAAEPDPSCSRRWCDLLRNQMRFFSVYLQL